MIAHTILYYRMRSPGRPWNTQGDVEITGSTSMTNSRQHPRRGGCCQCGGLDGNVLGTTQHKALLSLKIALVISDPTLAEFVTYSWRAFARASAFTISLYQSSCPESSGHFRIVLTFSLKSLES